MDRIGAKTSEGPVAPMWDTIVLPGDPVRPIDCLSDGSESPVGYLGWGSVVHGVMRSLRVLKVEAEFYPCLGLTSVGAGF